MQNFLKTTKCLSFFLVVLALSSCVSFNKTVRNPAGIQKSLSPFLWKAEKNGKLAYFFGTMHLPGLSLSNFPKEISDYIKNSQTFFVEADFSKQSSPVPLSEEQTLNKTLSKESWDKLKDFYRWQLSIQGMNEKKIEEFLPQVLNQIKFMNPWNIVINIDLLAFQESIRAYLGINDSNFLQTLLNQKMLDSNLLDYAKSISGLQISFLEEADTAMEITEKAHSVKDFDDLLKSYNTLHSLTQERVNRNYGQLICYEKADLACMEKELLVEQSSLVKGWQKTIVDRNKNWVPIIEKSLQSGSSFIAAGVSHFIGEDSVLELLKDRGFSIEQIQF